MKIERKTFKKMELNCSFGNMSLAYSLLFEKRFVTKDLDFSSTLSVDCLFRDEKEKLIKMALFALHCASLSSVYSLFNYFRQSIFLSLYLILLMREIFNCNLNGTLEFHCMQNF